MSLRRTIFVAVFVAVFATAAIEGVLDVIVDRVVGAAATAQDEGLVTSAAVAAEGGLVDTLLADRLIFDLVDIPLILVVALAGAWLIARRVARPLESLTSATRKVAEQSFPLVLPVAAGNDELARLTSSFNSMAGAIQRYIDR